MKNIKNSKSNNCKTVIFIMNVVLTVVFIMCFIGCGAREPEAEPVTTEPFVEYEGLILKLSDSKETFASLGEPVEYNIDNSCLYNEYQCEYVYDDVVINTYPFQNSEYIYSITINSDKAHIDTGINVGDNAEKISEVHESSRLRITKYYYEYNAGDYGISYYVENNVITSIELYTNEDSQ